MATSRRGISFRSCGFTCYALAAVCFLLGCNRSSSSTRKYSSSIWVSKESSPLTAANTNRLRESGIEGLILASGRLANDEVFSAELPEVHSYGKIKLSLEGDLPRADAAVFSRIQAFFLEATRVYEANGAFVEGYHLDLAGTSSAGAVVSLLEYLRGQLGDRITLSITVPPQWIDELPVVDEIRENTDFVIYPLFGQRPGEVLESRYWNFREIEDRARRLDGHEIDFQIGASTIGSVELANGRRNLALRASLPDLVEKSFLRLQPGFALDGTFRRTYAFVAQESGFIFDWRVEEGDTLRVSNIAAREIEELSRLSRVWGLSRFQGLSIYRVPNFEERLSLSIDEIAASLLAERMQLEISVQPEIRRRTARGYIMRFKVSNSGRCSTDLAFRDMNFARLFVLNGTFGSGSVGSFGRFDLLKTEDGNDFIRTFRDANILHLYAPVVESGQEVESGDFEVYTNEMPELCVGGVFIDRNGEEWKLRPRRFSGARLLVNSSDSELCE